MPVRRRGEPGQDTLRRVQSGECLERPGQGPGVCDAVEPEGPVLPDLGVRAGDVPPARMGYDPVRVQCAVAAPTIAVGVPDRDRSAVTYRIGDREQDPGGRGRELAGRVAEGEGFQ